MPREWIADLVPSRYKWNVKYHKPLKTVSDKGKRVKEEYPADTVTANRLANEMQIKILREEIEKRNDEIYAREAKDRLSRLKSRLGK